MTRPQLKFYIEQLLPDNQAREISAEDLRDAVIETYDSLILNAGGSGGVNLPIAITDVESLQGDNLESVLIAMGTEIDANKNALIPFTYDATGPALTIDAEQRIKNLLEISGDSPEIVLRADGAVTESKIRFMDDSNQWVAGITYDDGSKELTIGTAFGVINIDTNGNINAVDVAPILDTHLANKKYVDSENIRERRQTGIMKCLNTTPINAALVPDTPVVFNCFDAISIDAANGHITFLNDHMKAETSGVFTINYQGGMDSNMNIGVAAWMTVNGSAVESIIFQDGKGADNHIRIDGNITLDLKKNDKIALHIEAKNNTTVIVDNFHITMEKKIF